MKTLLIPNMGYLTYKNVKGPENYLISYMSWFGGWSMSSFDQMGWINIVGFLCICLYLVTYGMFWFVLFYVTGCWWLRPVILDIWYVLWQRAYLFHVIEFFQQNIWTYGIKYQHCVWICCYFVQESTTFLFLFFWFGPSNNLTATDIRHYSWGIFNLIYLFYIKWLKY